MSSRTSVSCLAALLLALPPAAAQAQAESSWRLEAADWARPRSGAAIVAMAPLPAVVRAWSAANDMDIVISHVGGEEGELWARELHDWLVALGVPGHRVRRVVGGADPHSLGLSLRPAGAPE